MIEDPSSRGPHFDGGTSRGVLGAEELVSSDARRRGDKDRSSPKVRSKSKVNSEAKGRQRRKKRSSDRTRQSASEASGSPKRRATFTSVVEIYRIDPLVAMRVSAGFFTCVYLMLVVAVAAMIIGGLVTGLTSGFTDFLAEIGWEDVQVNVSQLVVGTVLAGAIFVVSGALITSFLVVFYNLISEVVGGVRVVLSDETVSVDENVVDAQVD